MASEFVFSVMESTFDDKTFETKLTEVGKKSIYNLDGLKSAAVWVREETNKIKGQDAPQLTNPIKVKQSGKGRLIAGSLGYFYNDSNKVSVNGTNVGMFSGAFSHAQGLCVITSNFHKCIALFTARKSIKSNWINCKDEYMVPNTDHKDYEQWNSDAVVYSLFNTSSNQSSLRNVDYKGKNYNIENQWFWMSVNDIKVLANHAKDGSDDVWQDIKERFVYNKLQEITLSEDAKEVLDLATKLTKESFKYRSDFHSVHPEYQVNTWDAGWYQIKAIVKEYLPEELKKFNELYKRFEDRMRKGVYKFGFLKE